MEYGGTKYMEQLDRFLKVKTIAIPESDVVICQKISIKLYQIYLNKNIICQHYDKCLTH